MAARGRHRTVSALSDVLAQPESETSLSALRSDFLSQVRVANSAIRAEYAPVQRV